MSDLEKASVEAASHGSNDRHLPADGNATRNLPPDPDAHLSPEDRAQVVGGFPLVVY